MNDYLIGWIIVSIVCAGFGKALGSNKNAGKEGFFLGLVLGPIGVVVAALYDLRPACPHCGTKLNSHPEICPGCKTRFEWNGSECSYFPPD
jgi:hypothetical protein